VALVADHGMEMGMRVALVADHESSESSDPAAWHSKRVAE
jgi:hypothetical protein